MSRKVAILTLGVVVAVVFGVVGYRLGQSGEGRQAQTAAQAVIAAGLLISALGMFLQRRKQP